MSTFDTFDTVLRDALSADPGRPLVTFYDLASDERVELSVTTYANWVAKTASLLVEEHGLDGGERLRVDLPAHWLAPVFWGAAWSAGIVVTDATAPEAVDAVVCGPSTLATWAGRAGQVPVLACSLRPMGARFAEALPADVHDVGVEVWGQPDSFLAPEPVEASWDALTAGEARTTHARLWETARIGTLLADGGRLLVEADGAAALDPRHLAEPLARGGSLVVVVGTGPDRVAATADAERVTARVSAQPALP